MGLGQARQVLQDGLLQGTLLGGGVQAQGQDADHSLQRGLLLRALDEDHLLQRQRHENC